MLTLLLALSMGSPLFSACYGSSASPSDAGTDVRLFSGEPRAPALPEDTLPPSFTPCPPDWTEEADVAGVTICQPWPVDTVSTCKERGWARLPGEERCAPIGECPAGAYADD